MNIPDKVRISGMEYEVVQTSETILYDRSESGAITDLLQHKILINTTCQDMQGMKKTLLHEILHAIIYEREINLKDEESIVEGLAKGLYQVINDNPEIFREVCE